MPLARRQTPFPTVEKIDANQSAMIKSLASPLLGTTHSNGKEILDIIKQGHEGQAGLKAEIAQLRRAVSELNTRSPIYAPGS